MVPMGYPYDTDASGVDASGAWFLATLRRRAGVRARNCRATLDLHIADNLRAGMTPDEARRRALARLGSVAARNRGASRPPRIAARSRS